MTKIQKPAIFFLAESFKTLDVITLDFLANALEEARIYQIKQANQAIESEKASFWASIAIIDWSQSTSTAQLTPLVAHLDNQNTSKTTLG